MSLTDKPFITVVMATYGRGEHILASIRSVLNQTYDQFELIVVGDHCTDSTQRHVASVKSKRLSWINLDQRCGSQSAPNNAGIAAARGEIIAYCGHDDIWEPDHLALLAGVFMSDPSLDFAVSGAIYHMPAGVPGSQVTGLFDDDSAKHDHFFPPSSFAHRRDVCKRIGVWHMPMEIAPPVDAEFLQRAAQADLQFGSTGEISVHKFAAGHRYLSYIDQTSDEQQAMLASIGEEGHGARIAAIVSDSHRESAFMAVRHMDYSAYAPGELARQNAARKGNLQTHAPLPDQGAILKQRPSFCAQDWQDGPRRGLRWSNLNPNPRVLLPFTFDGQAVVRFRLAHEQAEALDEIRISCNGQSKTLTPKNRRKVAGTHRAEYHVTLPLNADKPTAMQLHLSPAQAPKKAKRGVGIGKISVAPKSGAATMQARVGRGFLRLKYTLSRRA